MTTSDNPYRATLQVVQKVAKGSDTVPKMREYHLSLKFKLQRFRRRCTQLRELPQLGD